MELLEDTCNNKCLVLGLGSYAHHAHIPTAGEHDSPAIKFPVATMAAGYLSLTLSLAGAGGYSPEEPVHSFPHGSTTVSNNSHSTAGNQNNAYPATNKRRRDAGGETERRLLQASDEEEGVGVRKKLKLTKEQAALLEESFKEHPTLNQMQKHALAKQLNLQARQVEVWFQNRRARTKLKQTEVDCESLKRCYESLTHENRRLQRELQELKARKLSSPLYMPTITMCPSCGRNEAAVPTAGGTTASAGEAPAKDAFGEGPRLGHNIHGHFATHSSAAC